MKQGTTNPNKRKLIIGLDNSKSLAWKKISKLLDRAVRKTPSVGLWKIEKYAQEGKIVVVPGKIIYDDTKVTKKNKVAAYDFSQKAKEALGSNAISLKKAFETDKTGKKVQVLI